MPPSIDSQCHSTNDNAIQPSAYNTTHTDIKSNHRSFCQQSSRRRSNCVPTPTAHNARVLCDASSPHAALAQPADGRLIWFCDGKPRRCAAPLSLSLAQVQAWLVGCERHGGTGPSYCAHTAREGQGASESAISTRRHPSALIMASAGKRSPNLLALVLDCGDTLST